MGVINGIPGTNERYLYRSAPRAAIISVVGTGTTAKVRKKRTGKGVVYMTSVLGLLRMSGRRGVE